MSHISKIELVISDVDILKTACARLHLSFLKNQQQKMKAAHNIRRDAIAVISKNDVLQTISVRRENDSSYVLSVEMDDHDKEFNTIKNMIGMIKQAYAVERVRIEAKMKRMHIREIVTDTGIQLVLTSYEGARP